MGQGAAMDARAILQLLPAAYREAERKLGPTTPLATLLEVMQELLQPIDDLIIDLPRTIDPRSCPEPLLPQLAAWLSDKRVEPVDSSCERELLANLADFSAHRGTQRALSLTLRLVAGCREVHVEESPATPFHLTVSAPESLRPELARLHRVLEQNKPAHMTAEVIFRTDDTAPKAPVAPRR